MHSLIVYLAVFTLCISVPGFFLPGDASAAEISVRLNVESRDVYQGESFLVQIEVNGTDQADPPGFSGVDGFSVEYMGGSNNSSQSISIINGKVERVVRKVYVFNYRFTPLRTGRLTIPPVKVDAEGEVFTTREVTIAVRKPGKSDDFKLRIDLSDQQCYTGEPVVMTVTWYLRKNIGDFRFTIPVLEDDSFDFMDPGVEIDRNRKYHRIRVGGEEVIAEEGSGILEGRRYTTLKFSKVMIPRQAGTFAIPEAVVECEAITGRSIDDFFSDDFFSSRRNRRRKYVVSSNPLTLRVKQLPLEGQPPDFSGHVGEYRISTSADPVKVNVGDPITLKVTLEGADYLGNVELPPLQEQEELTRDFKVPEERAAGKIDNGKKVFTQTIRARNDQTTRIPSIQLVYFDTGQEEYKVARSKPVPIEVSPTRIVTARDAEGIRGEQASAPLEKWKEGIAYNYQGENVIEPQSPAGISFFGKGQNLMMLTVPPLVYIVLLLSTVLIRKRRARPEARLSRGAHKRFNRRVKSISGEPDLSYSDFCSKMTEALRNYLGERFGRPGSAITGRDVEGILRERGVSGDVVSEVKNAMETLEAGSFAGRGGQTIGSEDLAGMVAGTVKKLEKSL